MRLPIILPPSAHSGSVGDIAKCHKDGAYSTVPNRPNRVGTNVRHYILLIPEMEQVREPCNDHQCLARLQGMGKEPRGASSRGSVNLQGRVSPTREGVLQLEKVLLLVSTTSCDYFT